MSITYICVYMIWSAMLQTCPHDSIQSWDSSPQKNMSFPLFQQQRPNMYFLDSRNDQFSGPSDSTII